MTGFGHPPATWTRPRDDARDGFEPAGHTTSARSCQLGKGLHGNDRRKPAAWPAGTGERPELIPQLRLPACHRAMGLLASAPSFWSSQPFPVAPAQQGYPMIKAMRAVPSVRLAAPARRRGLTGRNGRNGG